MLFTKIFGSLLLVLGLLNSSNVFASETLSESVAKTMEVEKDKIKLKKSGFGMTSSGTYTFELNDEKYIVKIFKKRIKPEAREREIENVKIIAKLGLGSEFVKSAEDNSYYIRKFTKGRIAKPRDFKNEDTLISLAKALKKLHEYKADFQARTQLVRFEKHYKSIMKKKVALPSGFEKEVERYKELLLSLPQRIGFCHNDLNRFNIIVSEDGGISLIDLANCGNANVFEELGYVTLLLGIQDENMNIFLKSYFERDPNEAELNAVKLAQKLTCFLTAVVWLDFSETKSDKKTPIETRRKALDDLLKSKDFKTAEEFIKEGEFVSVKSEDKLQIKQYAMAFYKKYLES